MKIDAWIGLPEAASSQELAGIGDRARMMEQDGYSGLLSAETSHDPFLPLALAAQHTERIELMTAIAVGFARNPMVLAHTAWDLQALSQGRFLLGLGSQIQAHITKRFSMPWSRPAARMEEMIGAIRAIWEAWQTGERLNFRGEFYRHTLMTPMFSPGPIDVAPPPILISAVGPLMTKVAGRAADGLVCHAFQTAEYLRDVTMPNVQAGLAEAGRDRSDFEISMPVFVVSGFREEEIAAQATRTRQQIAFYGSTPAYRGVLEHHGWGDAQTELNRLSKRGQWVEMGNVIDDDMLGAFAIVAEPHEVPGRIAERFGGTLDRLQFYAGVRDKDRWGPIIEEIKAA
ncbi:MAG: LLM class F420-dependent oxidoreductase [Acidimicrobiaceae bacterium]|nr:LLM class F420-dependent oxidoreductase [Acidimicrobiaceae bacterium]MDE0515150.1 LLM class F420-dependent oxidoreductase [Acidimicrobiaceae bacterium]MDE0656091.1 LLM class F420-dependent oxidoreductase [Acidimicrobiaceae bacterium]MYF41923.1 LLM class F420-dependent oxidoreductase [Acidimicrobiaceae bacterium]MYJ34809.1 LLM class F420-dependent oxidoreductase [Acidimicrobiaceae bacterium]